MALYEVIRHSAFRRAGRLLTPTILQRHRPIEHRLPSLAVHAIRHKVTMPLELELLVRLRR
jgi:hypothetical protein